MTLLNEADAIYIGDTAADRVYLGSTLVWEPSPTGPTAPAEWLITSYGTNFGRQDHTGEVGGRLRLTMDRTFQWIGTRCFTGNSGLHQVYLYDWVAGTRLVTADINMTGKAAGEWVWAAITPITLTAGVYYGLLKKTTAGDGQLWNEELPITMRYTNELYAAYRIGAGPLTTSTAGNQYVGVDLGWNWVEPTYEASEVLYGVHGGPSLPGDPSSFSVGSRMTVLAKGRITHFRYFRPSGSLASRYVAIWTDTGTLLADATTSGDIPGWNEWPLTTPLLVNAGTILRSAHGYGGNATDGGFPFDMGGVTPSGANLRFEGGVYSDTRPAGGGGELIYPANAILPNHYFGDVVFQKEVGALVLNIPPLVEMTPLPSQPEPPGGTPDGL